MTAIRVTAALLLAAACGGGGDDGDDFPDAGAPLEWNACAEADRVGGFEVELAADFTGVKGQVFDAVDPSFVLETVMADGACRMARSPIYFCEPACDFVVDTCGPGNQCVPRPVAQSVGVVTVTGLAASVEMQPLAGTNYYTNPGSLPHPGFTPGAAIALEAAGGAHAPFRLRGFGVSALSTEYDTIEVQSGAALPIAWTPPSPTGPTRMLIALNVNGHGVTGARIECEVDDTGSFTIPEPLITALVEDGLSGFPTLDLIRASADSTDLAPGCIDFRVQSARVIDVTIPGLISCNGPEDCPMGQTCMSDLTCG